MAQMTAGPTQMPAAAAEAMVAHYEPDHARKIKETEAGPVNQRRRYGIEARCDTDVSFEEYVHWAKIERELEEVEYQKFKAAKGAWDPKTWIRGLFTFGSAPRADASHVAAPSSDSSDVAVGHLNTDTKEKSLTTEPTSSPPAYDITRGAIEEEWRTVARALRTASWGSIFFLVTTDILGWSGAPAVFASVGWGPGVALYIIFGLAAAWAGWGIWKTFLGLDSARFPMLSFGDPFLRLFGPWARHLINIAQSLQQFLTVAVIVLANGQILAQMVDSSICYVVCILIIMLVGWCFAFIRSLRGMSFICNLAVWLNVANFIIIMYSAAKFAPNLAAAAGVSILQGPLKPAGLPYLPIKTFAATIPAGYRANAPTEFANSFAGVDTMVYAYSGAIIFVAFLAEMRRPMDFWKGIFLAQAFICLIYILFGAFVYGYWGQYAVSSITQVIGPVGLQTAANALSLITAWLAAFLYFNVGFKTVYLEVFQEIFHFPPIATKKGTYLWYALGPVYWAIAFVVAAAVPNLNGLVGFIGGIFSLNFTYSLPLIMYTGFAIQRDAALPGEGFDPVTGITTRFDSGLKRWARGYMKQPILNTFNIIYIAAALASSGMGTWSAIETLIAVFGPGGTTATSFGCTNPAAQS